MKMKKILATLLPALALGGCDNDGIPYVSLGLDDLYKVARMQTVDLDPPSRERATAGRSRPPRGPIRCSRKRRTTSS